MLTPEFSQVAGQIVQKALYGIALAGVGALLMWPLKYVRKEWNEAKEKLDAVQAELAQQRTNCLRTLQDQGVKQIELLTKATDTLDGVRLDLKEQTGFLSASLPKRRR